MATNKRVFTMRMQPENYDKVRVLAAINKRSVAMQIEYLIEKSINEYESMHGEIPLAGNNSQKANASVFNNQVGYNTFQVNNNTIQGAY